MNWVNETNLNLLNSALTHFIGEPIARIGRADDSFVFQTHSGLVGMVVENFVGDMDIWIGEDVVYEIERALFEVLEFETKELGLIEFYNYLKEVQLDGMQDKSLKFYDIVRTSTENIILNYNNLNLVGDAIINQTQIHYTKDKRIKINLN